MSLIEVEWNPSPSHMRRFGASTLFIMGLIGVLMQFAPAPAWWEPRPALALIFYIAGGVTGLFCVPGWRLGLPVYRLWMCFSFIVGNITNFILLSIFYYLVITPFGLVMRLSGRDKLTLKRPEGDSFWCEVKPTPEKARYERQF